MSLFDRLFGDKPPPLPAGAVMIDRELVATLTARGESLHDAVHTALRAQLAALEQPAVAVPGTPVAPESVQAKPEAPFWLERDSERDLALEDKLRDRVKSRRDTETDGKG
ncbi:MAG: hypothetical protein ACREN2_04395 [Candidatus Dormibacteria bacterium]